MLKMGKNKMVNCPTCSKVIRSDAMARHMRAHASVQLREKGRFAGRAPRPAEALPRPVETVPRPAEMVPLPVEMAPRLVEPRSDGAPRMVRATRPARHRSPSPPIFLLQPMRCEYLSQQSDVRESGHSKKRSKAILKKH